MKIWFLGTCAGTEPFADRKHASFAVECDERIYWFDAGEGCSYTAHLAGLDLLAVKKIVISHPHMDHVGGLGNLLWNIRKLTYMKKQNPRHSDIEVYIPCMETWEGIMKILRNTEEGFKTDFAITASLTVDGVLFDDGILKVTAYHNSHLRQQCAPWTSFSFLIEHAGKKLVYSGDVGSYHDLDELIGEGCDGLIIETGHFGVDAVYDYCKEKSIGKVFFFHNGREILNNKEGSLQKISRLFGESALITEDGMSVYL